MMRYSVQPRDRIFVKVCGFLSFARNMCKNIGKNTSKILISKYSQKILDHTKQSGTDALKIAWKRTIQKTEEATGDLTGNRIADKITKGSRSSLRNSSETVARETETRKPQWKRQFHVIIMIPVYMLKELY